MTNSPLQRRRRIWSLVISAVALIGFATVAFSAARSYRVAPPVPQTVYDVSGMKLFNAEDIEAGERILRENGLISGRSILGLPQFSCPDPIAFYLPKLAAGLGEKLARPKGVPFAQLSEDDRLSIEQMMPQTMRVNTYDALNDRIVFLPFHTEPLLTESKEIWRAFFSDPANSPSGAPAFVSDPEKLGQVADYLAWLAWASITDRPDASYSYTDNYPACTLVGNDPVDFTGLWLGLSIFSVLFVIGIVGFFKAGR